MRLRWSVIGICLLWALSGCSVLQNLSGGGGDALRVGTSGTYPPFTFRETATTKGIEIDFARAIAKELGRPVKIVVVPFPDLIGELNAGRIDVIMTGMSVTKERSALVSFATPYLEVGQMALVRMQDDSRLEGTSWRSQKGVRVGFERATTGAAYVKEKLRKVQPVEFSNKADALTALRSGKIDVLVHDAPFVWRTVGSPQAPDQELSGRFTLLTDEKIAWAVRKGDFDLLVSLNGVLSRWRNTGETTAVLDRWIKVRRISRPIP